MLHVFYYLHFCTPQFLIWCFISTYVWPSSTSIDCNCLNIERCGHTCLYMSHTRQVLNSVPDSAPRFENPIRTWFTFLSTNSSIIPIPCSLRTGVTKKLRSWKATLHFRYSFRFQFLTGMLDYHLYSCYTSPYWWPYWLIYFYRFSLHSFLFSSLVWAGYFVYHLRSNLPHGTWDLPRF